VISVKGRREDQPILLLIVDASAVSDWAARVTETAKRAMERYWPGALTLVFPARPAVLPELTGGSGTIGLRVPGSEMTRALLRAVGTALTATSANRVGRPGLNTAQAVAEALGGEIDLILDGGTTRGGEPSTVVDMSQDAPRIIRRGAVDFPHDR
jgi:L-threonylcarbamoyladenylate synthase